jgi:hypothetical protein
MKRPRRSLYHATGERLADDVIRITVPLTPSENEVRGWLRSSNIRKLSQHKDGQRIAVLACIRQCFPEGVPKPWGSKFLLWAVRCSDSGRRLDPTNARAGLKETEDAVVKTGLIPDDTAAHVQWSGDPEQRTPDEWGDLGGPATHLYIRRLE